MPSSLEMASDSCNREVAGSPLPKKQTDVQYQMTLYTSIGFKPESNPTVLLPTQVHDQPITMSHRLRVPVKPLKSRRVEEGMSSAQVEKPVN